MRLVWVFIFFVYSLIAFTATDGMPAGCQPIKIEETAIIPFIQNHVLILMHNRSSNDLWAIHTPEGNTNHSENDWSMRIEPDAWTAFTFEGKRFNLECIESRPGHEQHVACADVMNACAVVPTQFPDRPTNYLIVENKSLNSLMADLGSQGFALPALANGS